MLLAQNRIGLRSREEHQDRIEEDKVGLGTVVAGQNIQVGVQ